MESLDFAAGGSVGDVSADDLVFVHQKRGVDRLCGAGVVFDLVNVAHDLFAGEFAQVIALALLQGIVPVKNVIGLGRNQHLAGFLRRADNLPAEAFEKSNPPVVARDVLRAEGLLAAAEKQNQRQQHHCGGPQDQHHFFKIHLCGQYNHSEIPPESCVSMQCMGFPQGIERRKNMERLDKFLCDSGAGTRSLRKR